MIKLTQERAEAIADAIMEGVWKTTRVKIGGHIGGLEAWGTVKVVIGEVATTDYRIDVVSILVPALLALSRCREFCALAEPSSPDCLALDLDSCAAVLTHVRVKLAEDG